MTSEVGAQSGAPSMIELSPDRIAAAAGAEVTVAGAGGRPERAVVDSRELRPGDLFFGLPGEHADGGEFAARALEAGAWGVVVEAERARSLASAAAERGPDDGGGWVLAAPDPLAALQALARAWRRELGCRVVGITGSVGKTSVKDICHAILPLRVHASPENYNTEIGLPLAVLGAPPETRGAGAGDGDAGPRADRRAVRDRGAERRGDHQHRPRPPGAAGHPGGDRRGQGRDPRRARASAVAPSSPPTPRRSSPTCTTGW